MEYIKGDLLDSVIWDAAMHCANLHTTMGSGVAYFLKKKWPEVYAADIEYDTNFLDPDQKLGKFSQAILPDNRRVYNLYGQIGIGNDGNPMNRNCSYDNLYNAMYRACEDLTQERKDSPYVVGVPKLGCGLAGGSWNVVEGMLKDLEEKFSVYFVVFVID
jgi:O-acetyl-ADP-ribose deacetylase (regulator of RNase III)